MLKSARIALWDVLRSCRRKGSLDSGIDDGSLAPNDLAAFFLRHRQITHVFFNGAKAEECYHRHVLPDIKGISVEYLRLPSTSPANASVPYAHKLEAWQAIGHLCQKR